MALNINRREFIVGAAVLAALPLPVLAAPVREPFVKANDGVDFLYFEDWSRPFYPFGPLYVHSVGAWNGAAYEIVLMRCGWREEDRQFCDALDTEWSFFRGEVPEVFGRSGALHGYPNIHSYVRQKRYGENPNSMRLTMEINRLGTPVTGRGEVPLRREVH